MSIFHYNNYKDPAIGRANRRDLATFGLHLMKRGAHLMKSANLPLIFRDFVIHSSLLQHNTGLIKPNLLKRSTHLPQI